MKNLPVADFQTHNEQSFCCVCKSIPMLGNMMHLALCQSEVGMLDAGGLAPIWHQGICHHHDGVSLTVYGRSASAQLVLLFYHDAARQRREKRNYNPLMWIVVSFTSNSHRDLLKILFREVKSSKWKDPDLYRLHHEVVIPLSTAELNSYFIKLEWRRRRRWWRW